MREHGFEPQPWIDKLYNFEQTHDMRASQGYCIGGGAALAMSL